MSACVGTAGVGGDDSDGNGGRTVVGVVVGSGGADGTEAARRRGDAGATPLPGTGGTTGAGAVGGAPAAGATGGNTTPPIDGGSTIADGGADTRTGAVDARDGGSLADLPVALDVRAPADVSVPLDAPASRDGSASDIRAGLDGTTTDSGTATVWRPFNDASPWNTRIAANAAVDPNSPSLIADFSSVPGQPTFWLNMQQFSVPAYFVNSTTAPFVTVTTALGGAGFRTGAPNEGDVAGTGTAPIPVTAAAAAGTDRHLVVVDRSARMEWGFFNAARSGASWSVSLAATQDLSGTGVRPPERNSPWWAGHGPRACGFGLIAGLITIDEMKAGRIEHALIIAYPHMRSRYYTPPASTAQGTTGDAQPTRGILCGGHIQLDPTLDITTLGLTASGLVIARALQDYGAFVGDFSGAMSLYAESSPEALAYWATGILASNTAAKIPLNRFRVLQIGQTYDNMN